MASQNPSQLYPQVILSNPEAISASSTSSSSSSSNLYPSIDFAEELQEQETVEQTLIKIPAAIVHLIEKDHSFELASGEFSIVSLQQGNTVIAVFARVGDEIQWPLAKDEAAVKLDESHYFFTLRLPANNNDHEDQNNKDFELLNYGVTFASKGQDALLREFDKILELYSAFTVQEVKELHGNWEVVEGNVAKETSPEEVQMEEEKRELMEKSSAAYWTVLAPNVEDYSSCVARMIAAGSGQLIKGILWCGDVTVDRLRWGHEYFTRRMKKGENVEISPSAMRRIKRVKKLTKMSEKVANGILSGVVKVSGFFTSSIVNSKVGKKIFSLLPGEIVLASLDGFNKICDAVEVAGKNVMSTSSTVTTGLVSQRYGQEAAKVTNQGLDAAGHAIGTAWAVFKIRKALNPKGAFKATTLAKAAAKANAAEMKAKNKK